MFVIWKTNDPLNEGLREEERQQAHRGLRPGLSGAGRCRRQDFGLLQVKDMALGFALSLTQPRVHVIDRASQ